MPEVPQLMDEDWIDECPGLPPERATLVNRYRDAGPAGWMYGPRWAEAAIDCETVRSAMLN